RLVRAVRAKGHAEGDRRQAQYGHRPGIGRSGRAVSAYRSWGRDLPARATDTGGTRRNPEGPDRQMVAARQGIWVNAEGGSAFGVPHFPVGWGSCASLQSPATTRPMKPPCRSSSYQPEGG